MPRWLSIISYPTRAHGIIVNYYHYHYDDDDDDDDDDDNQIGSNTLSPAFL